MQFAPSETRKMLNKDREMILRALIRGVLFMITCAVALSAYSVWSDRPSASALPASPIVKERTITMKSEISGATYIADIDGTVLLDAGPGAGGFMGVMSRVVERSRTVNNMDMSAPVRLVKFANNRVAIIDDETNWSADLMGFGSENWAAFATLLDQ